MSTYTKYSLSSDTSLIASIYVVSGNTTGYTSFKFYYTDGSYLDALASEALNVFFVPFDGNLAVTDYINYDLNVLATEYQEGNTNYFNASSENVAFNVTKYVDGLYRSEITSQYALEVQWLLLTNNIDTKIQELATKLLNTQCNCKLNASVQETFIKAKAYQELIYNKVINLSTASATVAQVQEVLSDVNSNIATLTNFLEGSEPICGC